MFNEPAELEVEHGATALDKSAGSSLSEGQLSTTHRITCVVTLRSDANVMYNAPQLILGERHYVFTTRRKTTH